MLLRKFKKSSCRYPKGVVKANRRKCKLRYSSEVAFSSAADEEGLQDVILYGLVYILPHIHSVPQSHMGDAKILEAITSKRNR